MRVKSGPSRSKRHKKVLKRTKGFRMTKGRLYKVSKEANLHAGQYSYIGRRLRKRDLRRLWIQRIKASLKDHQIKYSQFVNLLHKEKIELDRKILADLAVSDKKTFDQIVETVKKASQ